MAMRFLIVVFVMALTVGQPCAGPLHEKIVARQIHAIVPSDGAGGVAVVLRLGGHTSFFNYGWADRANEKPVTSDSLFNLASLRKVFEATLLARSVRDCDLGLDDPVAKYISELQSGGDIRRVTLGQLATHTSGLLLPQDHPPWPTWSYTLPEFVRTLNAWKTEKEPGEEHVYTHAGFILLQLAMERRYGKPIDVLIEQRLLQLLHMTSTFLPRGEDSPRGRLFPRDKKRAVQGYGNNSELIDHPGEQRSYYHWSGTGQMFSSPRDMAIFLAANLGELPTQPALNKAIALAHRGVMSAISKRLRGKLSPEMSRTSLRSMAASTMHRPISA
jgi:beta-lactamase class C